MNSNVLTVLVLCAASTVYAQSCSDQSGSANCASWQKTHDFCKRSDAKKYCKKTCGGCTGVPPKTSCGISSVQQSRIINGVDAQSGAWPWIASLQRYSGHHCGATLLTPKWVITASHCVDSIKGQYGPWTIKLGAHDHRVSESSTQRIKIKRIIMHPSYRKGTLKSDLAMVELSTPAQLNTRVSVACLPQKGRYPSIGKQCYLAGWGSVQHPGGVYHTLQQARLPVVDATKCRHNNEVVCVGNGFSNQANGKQQPNACRGDSGGPLVCQQSDGRWQLEGVASFVYTYCKYYTGYSPVNKYLDWINSYIRT